MATKRVALADPVLARGEAAVLAHAVGGAVPPQGDGIGGLRRAYETIFQVVAISSPGCTGWFIFNPKALVR